MLKAAMFNNLLNMYLFDNRNQNQIIYTKYRQVYAEYLRIETILHHKTLTVCRHKKEIRILKKELQRLSHELKMLTEKYNNLHSKQSENKDMYDTFEFV